MLCFLTHRRLKPGSFDQFRAAWEGDGPPGGMAGRAYHVRSLEDPDEVISFGLFDLTPADLERMKQDTAGGEAEARRQERMAPFVERTGVDGIFEVVEEIGFGG